MIPATCELNWDDLHGFLNDHRTRLLAIGAASNALGTVNDIARAVAMAREAEALSFVDAVHFAPHQLIDVQEWGCDFLACSAYKFHGPHLGVLFGRRERLEKLDVPKLEPAPDSIPERLETGTQNHEGIVGAAAAVNYLGSLARKSDASRPAPLRMRLQAVFESIHGRESVLSQHLWNELEDVKGVRLFGPPPSAPRTPTIAFTIHGRDAAQVSRKLADRGIFASHGDFYATTLAERLGVAKTGLVRIGCACYTTREETDRVIDAVRAIAAGAS
jgi:selenocysteine lyase/cysteine desulfurase